MISLLLNVFGGVMPRREDEHLQGVLDFYFCGQLTEDAEPAPGAAAGLEKGCAAHLGRLFAYMRELT